MIVYLAQSPSGRVYVGITSTTLQTRQRYHKHDATKDTKRSICRAIKKYGMEALSWHILREVETREEACMWEKYYIKLLGANIDGYNCTSGGEGTPDHKSLQTGANHWVNRRRDMFKISMEKMIITKRLPEKRKDISEKRKNYFIKYPEEKIKLSRKFGGMPIEVYKNGEKIDVCPTLLEAARKYSVRACNIYRILYGLRKTTGGYSFKRPSSEISQNIYSPTVTRTDE